jgi:hypothetical protein
MTGPSVLFWCLLISTALVCLHQMLRSLIKARDILSLPFVACGIWSYFYVSMAYSAARDLPYLMPDWTMELGQFIALASLLALLGGWYAGLGRARAISSGISDEMPYRKIWGAGLTLLIITRVGQYSFFGFSGGMGTITENTSDYWYLMFYMGYPAAGLCLLALRRSARLNTPLRKIILGLLVLALMWQHIFTARRGPLFPMVVVLVYVTYMARRTRPSRTVVATSLVVAGITMVAFLLVRPYSYGRSQAEWTFNDRLDGWKEAVQHITWESLLSRQEKADDNEYIYHVGAIATIWTLSDYQWGTGYLTLVTHWIPRQLWKDKPALQSGLFPTTWFTEMVSVMGWGMSGGGATGGVANVFEQFGLLCPVFWYFFGFMTARVYRRTSTSRNDSAVLQYVGIICTLHWMIGQGFGAMFVPACYFILIPTWVLRHYRVSRTASDSRDRLVTGQFTHAFAEPESQGL